MKDFNERYLIAITPLPIVIDIIGYSMQDMPSNSKDFYAQDDTIVFEVDGVETIKDVLNRLINSSMHHTKRANEYRDRCLSSHNKDRHSSWLATADTQDGIAKMYNDFVEKYKKEQCL